MSAQTRKRETVTPVSTSSAISCSATSARSARGADVPLARSARTVAVTGACSGDRCGRAQLRVQRMAIGDRGHALGQLGLDAVEAGLQRAGDDVADLAEVLGLHAAGGERRRADAQP